MSILKLSGKFFDPGDVEDYVEAGYQNRRSYLESLFDEYDSETVLALADLLGPSEDFDGLIAMLEDSA